MKTKTFAANEVIFNAGVYERCMYVVDAGTVEIFANYGKESQSLLKTVEAGQFFGEMGLVEANPRSATAAAGADGATVVEISADEFGEYFKTQPEIILSVMRQMSARIRELSDDYADACRAVAEAMDNKNSGWLKTHVKRFLDDYRFAMQIAAEQGYTMDQPHSFF